MRKNILLLLLLTTTSLFADKSPIFEEADDDEASYKCNVERCTPHKNTYSTSYQRWRRYKANFGIEKVFVRFPKKPVVSQNSTMLTAYAYDGLVLYSFSGYYPPVDNLDPSKWFEEILNAMSVHPYACLNHSIYQTSDREQWVLDYTAHDYVQNIIIKTRAVITPFNGYTIQCTKPNGSNDQFEYFLDNFRLRCECYECTNN